MTRFLVTGAAGFIGTNLCSALALRPNASVLGLDNFNDYYNSALKRANARHLAGLGIDVLEGDLRSLSPSSLPEDIEYIIHAAAQPGLSAHTSFDSYLANNVSATHNLLLYAQRLPNLALFVNLSTSSVYGLNATVPESAAPEPVSFYGVTKLAAEQLCLSLARGSSFPACSLRLFSVYGPRERPDKLLPRLLRAAYTTEPFPYHDGAERHVRSFTFIDDIIAGILSATARPAVVRNQIYNLGSPVASPTGSMISLVEEETGRPVTCTKVPPRPGDQAQTLAVIDKAQRDLQYAPNVSLRVGIRRTVRWAASEMALRSCWGEVLLNNRTPNGARGEHATSQGAKPAKPKALNSCVRSATSEPASSG